MTGQDLDDEMPVFCNLNIEVNTCDCCGKSNLKRTIQLDLPGGGALYLGVICAGRWFKLNMTGNPWYAADRLAKKLRKIKNEEISEIVQEIQDASEESH